MPNRIIKESIRTSKALNKVSDFAFRVWSYLITYVDDFGRGSADAQLLKGLLCPRMDVSEEKMASALQELSDAGLIVFYVYDGEPFFFFPKWKDHQQIRNQKSKFPEPDGCILQTIDSNLLTIDSNSQSIDINCNQLQSIAVPIQSNTIQSNTESNPIQERSKKFTPPALADVEIFVLEEGLNVDAQRFIDYYTSNGWIVGKTKMKDWKAACRGWSARETASKPKTTKKTKTASEYEEELKKQPPVDLTKLQSIYDRI